MKEKLTDSEQTKEKQGSVTRHSMIGVNFFSFRHCVRKNCCKHFLWQWHVWLQSLHLSIFFVLSTVHYQLQENYGFASLQLKDEICDCLLFAKFDCKKGSTPKYCSLKEFLKTLGSRVLQTICRPPRSCKRFCVSTKLKNVISNNRRHDSQAVLSTLNFSFL